VAILSVIDSLGAEGALIGGIAVGLLSAPRFTLNVDAVMWAEGLRPEQILEAAEAHGLERRVPDILSDARTMYVMQFVQPAAKTNIDLCLAYLPFERQMLRRVKAFGTPHGTVRVPCPEVMIVLKACARRRQDIADIRAIAEANPGLDKREVERWVREFGAALDEPDLWETIQPLLDVS
jgi:hypothetical protein